MSAIETRILPLASDMSAEYAIVSMPRTAWYWLDDMVSQYYPDGYHSLMRRISAKDTSELAFKMGDCARSYCDRQMSELYGLANDNEYIFPTPLKSNAGHPSSADYSARMPTVYQLFRFMPHATYLTTVWERRNYHLQGDFL